MSQHSHDGKNKFSRVLPEIELNEDTRLHLEWLSLQGGTEICHSERRLDDHLLGVHNLLQKWGNTKDVCLAGLFHSVYGTQTFARKCITMKQRPAVKQRIGERAERWVYLFATQNRDQWFDAVNKCSTSVFDASGYATRISQSDVSVLLEIELANIVEQLPHRTSTSTKTLRVYAQQIEKASSVVSNAALLETKNALVVANLANSPV